MALYDNMKLEKGMYQTAGKSFSQVLEELDPSGDYRGGQSWRGWTLSSGS